MAVTLSLDNKVALITGGSRGIGAATVRMFVQAGAKVVFNYQQAQDAAEKLARECGGDRCIAVRADLTGTEHARDLVEAAVQHFGRLDAVVVNHGIWPGEDMPIDRMPEEHWRRTMAVNLDSVFGVIRYAVGQMKRQKTGGKIVALSSTAGQRGEAFHVDYAATKGAVISMVKGLSTELAPHGIYVNCVAPGWVDTDMAAPALQNKDFAPRVFASIPLGRVGKPEEIAATILFLCTEHAGFITGEVVNVNGGAVLVG